MIRPLRPRFFRLFSFAVAALLLAAAVPHAAAQEGRAHKARYSEAEKIGFAFYKLANKQPPFENWLKQNDEYLFAKPSAKRDYLRRETERLVKGYSEYMVDQNLIHIRTKVKIRLPSPRESASYEKMGVRRPIRLEIPDVRENYFPIQLGDMWIAVVADKLEDYTFLPLGDDEYDQLISQLRLEDGATQRSAYLELRLHPVSIDLSQPMALDGIEAWLMLAEIASLSIFRNEDRSGGVIWEKNMDWYVPQQQQELLNLYSR